MTFPDVCTYTCVKLMLNSGNVISKHDSPVCLYIRVKLIFNHGNEMSNYKVSQGKGN
jgi:hypothetical protein